MHAWPFYPCGPVGGITPLEHGHHCAQNLLFRRYGWLGQCAAFFANTQFLVVAFFCSRNNESRANVRCILPTLAWDIARQDSIYREALLGVLQTEPDVADCTIDRQVHHLLDVIFYNERRPPPIFIVDALYFGHTPFHTLSSSGEFLHTPRPEPYIR